jgi:hypothetical protein
MSCQSFGNLLQQYGNIITDVCCLELEVNNAQVGYSVQELKHFCLNNQNYLLTYPAVYLFLVGNEELARFLGYSYITYNKYWRQCTNIKKENSTIFKKLEMFIESQNFVNYQSYIPLYVGETDDFQQRYNQFKNTLSNNCNGNHVFGKNFCSYLKDLCQINSLRQYSMKMCLVVFYTDSEDKAQCIESSILNHNDFCKIFNKNNSNCSINGFQQQIANDIIKTIQDLQSCP